MTSLSDLAAQSNQIAQQNNPEFAALNTIVQSRVMPYEGFGKFVQETLEPERNRKHQTQLLDQQFRHQKQLQDELFKHQQKLDADNYRRSLEHAADLQGINADFSTMTDSDLRRGIFAQMVKQNSQNPAPLPQFGNMNGGQVIEKQASGNNFNPQGNSLARTNITDTPPMNASGRISNEADLLNINKIYPHLSRTPEGRDFLRRVEQTHNANPYNLGALTPLLQELQAGSLELVPQNRTIDRSPYKGLKTSTDLAWDTVQGDNSWVRNVIMAPGNAIGIGLANLTDVGANATESEAAKHGYIPPRRQENTGLLKPVKDWIDNYSRVNAANEYMEKFKETYKLMKERGIKPLQTSPHDQVTESYKEQLALRLELPSTQFIKTGIDGFGRLTLVVDGRLFIVDKNGNIIEQ